MLGPKEEFREILQHFRAAFDGPELACKVDSVPIVFEVVDCALSLLPKPHKTSKRPADLRPQYAYIPGKSIDGAIARVMRHGAMLSLDLSRAFDEEYCVICGQWCARAKQHHSAACTLKCGNCTMLLSLNAVARACVPYAIAASVRTEMDHAQEDLEAARAKTAREELRMVMGGGGGGTSSDQQMRDTAEEKEMAEVAGTREAGAWDQPQQEHQDAQLPQLDQDLSYMVFINTSGLGCLPVLRRVAENWQEQYTKGTVTSPLRLVMFLAMLETLKTTVEETMADEEKLQRCMNVGWTVAGENALSPKWVYHSWDPAAKRQIVAEDQPLSHADALRLVDQLMTHDQYKAEVLPFMVSIGPRGESSAICFNALRILSGSAIMKLIGVRVRPERGQEPQLIKQLKQSYMGTTFCEWSRKSTPWSNVKLRNRTNLCYCNAVFQCLYWLGEANSCKDSLLLPSDLGIPLLLHLPGEKLQTLVDSWHNQFATHALTYHGGGLFLQICDVVAMPVFTEVGSACTRLEQFRDIPAAAQESASARQGCHIGRHSGSCYGDWQHYDVSSEEDGAEEDLVLIPPCSGATAAGYGSISEQAITTSAGAGDSSNYSLNTMD
ncbi:unnamed protein product [Symbiodinium necroappetens]|uniref:Uncharacterized protein n=1 Tax=Symbiodinium necroappetens TaxID=1628268 RepID=A0A812PVZ7_9DINO|nr:unnamed protein product [Symbiodinium necroappetens]